jgi:hypothetical protein
VLDFHLLNLALRWVNLILHSVANAAVFFGQGFFFCGATALVGPGLPYFEASSISHTI